MSLKVVFRLAVISIIGAAVVGQVLGSRDDATGAEIRDARSRLGWSASELAKRAHVLEPTVKRAERSSGELMITVDHHPKIRAAFEAAGVKFASRTTAATMPKAAQTGAKVDVRASS